MTPAKAKAENKPFVAPALSPNSLGLQKITFVKSKNNPNAMKQPIPNQIRILKSRYFLSDL